MTSQLQKIPKDKCYLLLILTTIVVKFKQFEYSQRMIIKNDIVFTVVNFGVLIKDLVTR